MSSGTRYSPWAENAMRAAQRIREPAGASEFGGAPGPDAHAHADAPPTHAGYRQGNGGPGSGRYQPISPPQSPDDISTGTLPRGAGGTAV
jgi:hypothetical protein